MATLYYSILCMCGFSIIKSEKERHMEDSNILTFSQIEVLDRWDRGVKSNLVMATKKVLCVFSTNWTGQSCCLLKHGPFLRDSLWRWLFIVPFDSAILVIADWPREGFLNKGMYLYSRVSQSAHYWYFGLDNFLCGVLSVHWRCLAAFLTTH